MKLWFCTDPGRPLTSVIPPDVAETCDVQDVPITTNHTAPDHVREAAALAKSRKLPLVVDTEHIRTAFDVWQGDRSVWQKNVKLVRAEYQIARTAAGKGVSIGVYDKRPGRDGVPRDRRTFLEYLAYLGDEAKIPNAIPADFHIAEGYVVRRRNDAETLARWMEQINEFQWQCFHQNPALPVYVITSPWEMHEDYSWEPYQQMSDGLFEGMLRHCEREGLRPLVFNPGPDVNGEGGWATIRKVAAKN